MHDIADVKIKNPVILILHSKDSLNVILQLDISNSILLEGGLTLLRLVHIIVC